ncbi:MAG: metal ABC transporter permease [Gemmataceae bacterium]
MTFAWLDSAIAPVAGASVCLGIATGVLGGHTYVRRQSLQSDVLTHAALPGVLLAFLLGARSLALLLIGGMVAAYIALAVVRRLQTRSRLPTDTALAAVLATFFGFGLTLWKPVYSQPDAAQTGLHGILFGQNVASLMIADFWTWLGIGIILLGTLTLLHRGLFVVALDPQLAVVQGWSVLHYDRYLLLCVVVATVLGLQIAGVVLLSTLFIAPAAAARQWTSHFNTMLILSGLFGGMAALAGVFSGVLLGEAGWSVPTGPLMAVAATILTISSMIIAPFLPRNQSLVGAA